MGEAPDTNAAIWQSAEAVEAWAAEAQRQEGSREAHRRFMALMLPFAEQAEFTFLDLGAGTGAASRAILRLYPRSTAVLADFSAEMMRASEPEMEPFAGRYRYVQFDMASGQWPAEIPAALDAVVTSMCVHHLPDDRKRGLFAEISAALAPGGWYLNYDPVQAEDPVVEATWDRVRDREDPEGAARRRHRSPLEQARWDNHVRYIIPLGPQLEYLRAAGFEGVDVYWRHLENVIYGGRRPGNPAARS
jgi:tRNA (cmo5U34)-methyltransferase